MRIGYRVCGVVMSLVLLLSCSSCDRTVPASRTGFALDTVVSVTVYEANTDKEKLLDDCFTELERLEGLLSATIADSDISHINGAGGKPVVVAEETAELLSLSQWYGRLSDGAFDITMRPVTALWDFSSETVPDAAVLSEAVSLVDYRRLAVEGTTVTLPTGALEPGGIAKGYIADRLCDLLRAGGATSALIDLGGNIVVLGQKGKSDWRVGIKDPANTAELCAVVSGSDLSVVTSGIYERGFTKDGVRYHHLLSPETGEPVQNELASVTIVSKSSVQADALSTACFVMGEEKGMALAASLDGVEVLFVRRDGTIRATAGLSYETV